MIINHRYFVIWLLFFILYIPLACYAQPPKSGSTVKKDVCEGEIPKSLEIILKNTYKDYRLATMADQPEDAIVSFGRSDICFMAARGDFAGNHTTDYAVLLTNRDLSKVKLIAALKTGNSWSIHQLPTWCGSVIRCFVETVKPGLYRRNDKILPATLQPNEKHAIRTTHDGIGNGTMEATEIIHVFQHGLWHYVWVSS